jgi:hypothetical protein
MLDCQIIGECRGAKPLCRGLGLSPSVFKVPQIGGFRGLIKDTMSNSSYHRSSIAGATLRAALIDRYPEYSEYSDEGCKLSPSCLKCPLPKCRLDVQAEGRRSARLLRDREILRQRKTNGKTIAQLAQSYGLSTRTIHRIIRRSSHE